MEAEIAFIYGGESILIQCNINQKMKEIVCPILFKNKNKY